MINATTRAFFVFIRKIGEIHCISTGADSIGVMMEAVMAWNRIGCLAALSLAFVFTACGDDSSSGSSKTEQMV